MEVKEYSVVRIITSGILRRSSSSYIACLDDVVEHEGMEEDSGKILMLWYIKKEVWTLMLIRKVINISKACAKCGNLSDEWL